MPTISKFATNILDNIGANTSNWGADDGVKNNNPTSLPWSVDVTMEFPNFGVPSGATINGITVEVEGSGNPASNSPKFQAREGSSGRPGPTLTCNGSFSKSDSTQTWGGSSTSWGISWNSTNIDDLNLILDVSTIGGGGRIFWDYVKAIVDYTETGYGHDVIGVASSDITSINGVPTGDISNIIGV